MTYPKIHTLYKRDENGRIILFDFSKPEFQNIDVWHLTEKINGTNIQITYTNITGVGMIEAKGRHDKSDIPKELQDYLREKFTLKKMREVFGDAKKVTIYAEGIGKGINSIGKHYSEKQTLVIFDIVIDDWWLEYQNVKDIAKKLNISVAPFLGLYTKENATIIAKTGFNSQISEKPLDAEGIVAKTYPLMLFRDKTPIMFKLKHKDFKQ